MEPERRTVRLKGRVMGDLIETCLWCGKTEGPVPDKGFGRVKLAVWSTNHGSNCTSKPKS